MPSKLRTAIINYLALVGLAIHIGAIGLYIAKPWIVYSAIEKVTNYLPGHSLPFAPSTTVYNLADEISSNFHEWRPLENTDTSSGQPGIDARQFASLTEAGRALQDGQTLTIRSGVYRTPLIIEANNTTIIGSGHVIIEETAAEGKAAILIKGNNTTIKNIECRHISVKDNNGACVRLEGQRLRLLHVYFHNSQQGLLTGSNPGLVEVEDSRFERLGFNGSAHGIYIGGGHLSLHNSLFLAAKNQGHEIKSRAESTVIDRCVIASLSSDNSRLIDISNGGKLQVSNSVLEQGPGSVNQDVISYGLEGKKYETNTAALSNNIFILERTGNNVLFHKHPDMPAVKGRHNIFISKDAEELEGINFFFKTRSEAGLKDYPQLPDLPPSQSNASDPSQELLSNDFRAGAGL